METFDPQREAEFRADYGIRTQSIVRFGLALGAVLYTLFAPLDIWMLPESWRQAHIIRFAVVLPVCLVALGLTFIERTKRHLQILTSVFVVLAGLGIVAMILLARESEPGFKYYYAGLMLVVTYSFSVVRLRFRPAAFCCMVIIVAYEFVAILDQHLLAQGLLSGPGPVFINNNFFLVSAGIITLFGAYALENYSRKDFRRRNELATALEELRAAQAQLVQTERSSAMANVVAGLLHELNTPVGVIVGAADVVHRGALRLGGMDEDGKRGSKDTDIGMRRKTIAVIGDSALALRRATERVKEALEVLKRFSRLDQAEMADYDVNAALTDCLTLLAHHTGERIVVKKVLDDVPRIRCRAGEINQLFMSVLKNAVEAIPDTGSIELRTSARDGFVRVDIIDTGIGIPEARLKDIFAPRFGEETGRVKLGLGLITSQSIVHRHGGEIVVDSVEGQGTHVSIALAVKAGGAPGA